MAEISGTLAAFFDRHLGDATQAAKREKQPWHPDKLVGQFFKALEKTGKPLLRREAGRDFAELLFADLGKICDYQSTQEAVSFLPKIYNHFIRGDGAGIWISEQVSDGFVALKENTPLDCLFTEGMLSGLLARLGARGAMVRHTSCRKEKADAHYCKYELVWMKRVK